MKITKEGIAVIEGDTHISKWVEETGRLDHDQNTLPRILKFIKPGDTVIDCGAFIGDHTIAYSEKVGGFGYVIGIESNPEAYECLKYNLSKAASTTCFINNAVSDVSESGLVIVPNENAGASSVSIGNSIYTMTIDSLKLAKCNLIKMDIEGFEVKALNGARETIKKFRPYLVIEINEEALNKQGNTPQDIFNFLKEMDYIYCNIYPGQLPEGPQYDIICIP